MQTLEKGYEIMERKRETGEDAGRPVYMRNRLVKLSIECNTVDIHTYIYIHT